MAVMGNVDGLKVRDREVGSGVMLGGLTSGIRVKVLPSDRDGGSFGTQPCCRAGQAFPLE